MDIQLPYRATRGYDGLYGLEVLSADDLSLVGSFPFASGLSAEMVPSGQGAEMRFSSGERVPVHTRAGE